MNCAKQICKLVTEEKRLQYWNKIQGRVLIKHISSQDISICIIGQLWSNQTAFVEKFSRSFVTDNFLQFFWMLNVRGVVHHLWSITSIPASLWFAAYFGPNYILEVFFFSHFFSAMNLNQTSHQPLCGWDLNPRPLIPPPRFY